MADSDLQITFSGDASGVKTAADQASAAIGGVVAGVAASQAALGQFKQAMSAAVQAPDVSGATAAVQLVAAASQAAQAAMTASASAGADARGQINLQSLKKMEADWNSSVGAMTRKFGDGLLRMAQGSETFQKVINQTANQIESYFVNAGAKMVSDWLFVETHKSAITATATSARNASEQAGATQSRLIAFETAQKTAFNNAVSAASGAYSAMAGIPIVGPALGAIAAAVTFTAVEAYGALASAAGGYDIPAGVNPLVQAHAQEMILPARIANPMRDMLATYSGAAGGPSGPASGVAVAGGDVHNWNISAMDPRSFETYLRRNSDILAGALNAKVRAGAKITGV
jgi:hypothetical protein